MRRATLAGLLVAAAALLSACAPPAVRLPEGEDYVFPDSPPGVLTQEDAGRMQSAWRDVLSGHATAAEAVFQKLLERHPGLPSVQTAIAYARLRQGHFPEAAQQFDAVLEHAPDYVPALIGAASAAVRRGDADAALGFYRRADSAQPGNPIVGKRLAAVKLQVTEKRVAGARAALAAGETERALAEYRGALDAAPELAALRVELADVLERGGDAAGAIAVLEADPQGDRQVLLRLGDLLSGQKEYGRAFDAYSRILSKNPKDAEAIKGASAARQAFEMQQMPEEYRRIFSAPRLSRADLAALVAVKVPALARVPTGTPKVAVDISGSWAREHILKILALDIMDVYPNHTFQPAAIVRRGDLARAVARVLDLIQWRQGPAPKLTDMSPNNIFYDAASRVVAAGLMDLTPEGAFEPWRPVSGSDAAAVVEALVRLVGP
jgi:tetratricopeptide (TPR) repeat protein